MRPLHLKARVTLKAKFAPASQVWPMASVMCYDPDLTLVLCWTIILFWWPSRERRYDVLGCCLRTACTLEVVLVNLVNHSESPDIKSWTLIFRSQPSKNEKVNCLCSFSRFLALYKGLLPKLLRLGPGKKKPLWVREKPVSHPHRERNYQLAFFGSGDHLNKLHNTSLAPRNHLFTNRSLLIVFIFAGGAIMLLVFEGAYAKLQEVF